MSSRPTLPAHVKTDPVAMNEMAISLGLSRCVHCATRFASSGAPNIG